MRPFSDPRACDVDKGAEARPHRSGGMVFSKAKAEKENWNSREV